MAHMMSAVTMRRRHLQRSSLLRLTTEVAYFWCSKGKGRSREGFAWSCPAATLDGRPVIKLCRDQKLATEQAIGTSIQWICFEPTSGKRLAMSAIVTQWRRLFASKVSNPKPLTSYSMRRMGPTQANARSAAWEFLLPIGAW